MKRIIVTGATSMIGTALIGAAVSEGTEVYAIVRSDTNRMNRLIASPLLHVVEANLDSLLDVERIPENCDVLYHFAWVGTGKTTRDDPEIQEQNIQYTLDAVKLAKKAGCNRFVGAGSQAEYGPVYGRIDQNTGFAPVMSYGIAKYAASILSKKLCDKISIEHVWGRIFSIYGPHDNEGTMLEYAIRCWDKGETASFSSGMQSWNYLYESDAGEMFYRMGCDDVPPDIYFVANPVSCRLREYINTLIRVYGENAKACFAEPTQVMLPGLDVDMKRTISVLKYEPKIGFEEGIKNMIDAISAPISGR